MGAYPGWAWAAFGVLLLVLLAIDLAAHWGGRGESRGWATFWAVVWVAAGLAFNAFVWVAFGRRAGEEYLAAYLIEKSLSLDNLFVFLLIFGSLGIPPEHQRKALSWGIFGALVFRGLFVFLGAEAVERWAWVEYVFAGILLVAAVHAFREDPEQVKESKLVRWLSRHLPVVPDHSRRFFVRQEGGWKVTPLLVAVLALELTDVLFAVDSVPAAFAVTHDRFILYSSNAFAILGLRSLYIILAGAIAGLRYLHYGLAGVLVFAAAKMLAGDWVPVPPLASVAVIVGIVGLAVVASLLHPRGRAKPQAAPETDHSPAMSGRASSFR